MWCRDVFKFLKWYWKEMTLAWRKFSEGVADRKTSLYELKQILSFHSKKDTFGQILRASLPLCSVMLCTITYLFNSYCSQALALNKDGNFFVSGGFSRYLRVWRTHDLCLLHTYPPCDGSIRALTISTDQRYVTIIIIIPCSFVTSHPMIVILLRCLVAGLASGSILAIAVNFPGRLWPGYKLVLPLQTTLTQTSPRCQMFLAQESRDRKRNFSG